ncbi:hypothetical protein RJ639_020479 [Escallonia herrerae]|uniref:SET domain-containing protein n=1 Tax=Escallonia herrerae TaxID=1293975 RepID=A0AA88V4E1_9ASTE|nr:hypothetical protein RJ639_020479 [Escallonia herrerae]
MSEAEPPPAMEEEKLQQLRSKATELLLREEWRESIQAYSHFITLCQTHIANTTHDPNHLSKLQKSLCLAFSNRAEARSRLKDFSEALRDCDEALKMESTHFKTLICKGKLLLNLDKYSKALDCFKIAIQDPQANANSETLNGYLEKCKKLEFLSKSGAFDISDWVLNGFRGKSPDLAEYIGAVEIKTSDISGRGLFATRNIDIGTPFLVTKAIATERGILPQNTDSSESVQLVMWKNFIDKVVEASSISKKTHHLICKLSTGENNEALEVPDINLFRPEVGERIFSNENLEMGRMLSILDVNSLVEDAISAKVLGKNSDYYGIGLWLLASFVNHSCNPNAKRLHIGDHVIVHASRDIKAGEEVTCAYFDVLLPLSKRKQMATNWGFSCNCKRCRVEEGVCWKQDTREIEIGIERGVDLGGVIYRLEEGMRRWMVRGKGKGYLRASFWGAYAEVFESDKLIRRWGRRIPAMEAVVDSVVDAVGSDERILKVFMEGVKRNGGGGKLVEMERAMQLGRGVYGKVMKKQAMRNLLELTGMNEQS